MDRLEQLKAWLAGRYPNRPYRLSPASADASFRRYFRLAFEDDSTGADTRIIMDAPPEHEDCRPFIAIAALFGATGAHVPTVHAQDLELGFLELSDLGSTTYLQALTPENAAGLYAEALGSLCAIQGASQSGVLPEYNRELLLRELELFPVWYLARHKGVTLSEAETDAMYAVFESILAVNLAEPQVFVHRDFHSRNLMASQPNPGILDFQDAVYGPLSYDLASLLKDAYIEWPEAFCLDMLARYWDAARAIGLPVRADFADFHRDYEFMGAQRHIKVLGIFARLYHRDGKDGYLANMPLVLKYLHQCCRRYGELLPLARLLEKVEPSLAPRTGHTF